MAPLHNRQPSPRKGYITCRPLRRWGSWSTYSESAKSFDSRPRVNVDVPLLRTTYSRLENTQNGEKVGGGGGRGLAAGGLALPQVAFSFGGTFSHRLSSFEKIKHCVVASVSDAGHRRLPLTSDFGLSIPITSAFARARARAPMSYPLVQQYEHEHTCCSRANLMSESSRCEGGKGGSASETLRLAVVRNAGLCACIMESNADKAC